MKLDSLKAPAGSRTPKKRLGRGVGSGLGKTAGRGHKGHRARTGGKRPGHEGGQMPLVRLLPKRGFRPLEGPRWTILNLEALNRFPSGAQVDPEALRRERLVRRRDPRIKILAGGTLRHPLVVTAHAFSAEARKKIEAAGGQVRLLNAAPTPSGVESH